MAYPGAGASATVSSTAPLAPDLGGVRVLELFAGIGGMRCSLERAELPHQIVAAFDVSELCEKAYRHNFGGEEWKKKTIECLKAHELDVLAADMWLMSPPCQPFTRAGKRKDHEDDRSRGLLHLLGLLPLMEQPPAAILLENVVGFERSVCRQRLLRALASHGWEMAEFALDPEDFGLPSRRPRYYGLFRHPERLRKLRRLAQSSGGCFWSPVIEEAEPLLQGRCARSEEMRPLGDFLQDPAALALEEQTLGTSIEVPQEVMRTRQQKDQRYDIHQRADYTSACLTKANGKLPFGHSPLDEKFLEQRPKLSSQGTGSGAATDHVWQEGLRVRYLSPVEQLRLMGFPESYSFPASLKFKDDICSLIGNSLNCCIVSSLLPFLFAGDRAAPDQEGCRRASELAARAWGPRERWSWVTTDESGIVGMHSLKQKESKNRLITTAASVCFPVTTFWPSVHLIAEFNGAMGVGRSSVPQAKSLEACAGLRLLKPKDWDEALEVCAQAMNGTEHCEGDPMLNFVLGPKMSNYNDPRRLEVLRFLAALILEEDWRWSWHSLALAMEAPPEATGTLGLAAVCLARRNNGGASSSCLPCVPWFCCRKWSRRFPGACAHVMGEAADRMMGPEGLEMQLHERRLIYAAEPHFSILLMMVNPTFQGRTGPLF
eukprot:s3049_g2.t1